MAAFPLCPYMTGLFLEGHQSHQEGSTLTTSSKPNYFQRPHLQVLSHWEVGLQPRNLGVGTIPSIALKFLEGRNFTWTIRWSNSPPGLTKNFLSPDINEAPFWALSSQQTSFLPSVKGDDNKKERQPAKSIHRRKSNMVT